MKISKAICLLVLAFVCVGFSGAASAQLAISVSFGPPALPIYVQPPCPQPGYLWTPGYWSYGPDGYFWVPGTWVMAPRPGLLWTPGWWGWGGSAFIFHVGYWGPQIGFYGGINYGFGYIGHGYEGGEWRGGNFYYNRSVTNVTNVTNITNVYNKTVINNNNVTENRVSYNGGEGGVTERPTPQETAVEHQQHVPATAMQTQHEQLARSNPELRASVNQGKPPIAATAKPAEFKGPGVQAAKSAGAPYKAPAAAAGNNRTIAPANTAREVPRPPSSAGRPNATPGAEKPSEATTTPRPGNNVPKPGNANAAVPRPPSNAGRPNSGRPTESDIPAERNATARPGNNAPRPSNNGAVPRPATSPVNTLRPQNNPRQETAHGSTPRPGSAPRPPASHESAPPKPAPHQTAQKEPAPHPQGHAEESHHQEHP